MTPMTGLLRRYIAEKASVLISGLFSSHSDTYVRVRDEVVWGLLLQKKKGELHLHHLGTTSCRTWPSLKDLRSPIRAGYRSLSLGDHHRA